MVNLHVTEGNTPTLRLEQDGTSGFTPQTWDVAGNEANFFIRDVTNGSKLPFKIKPGAPTSSIFVSANGDIGMNTENPSQPLHVRRTDGTAKILVEEASGTSDTRTLMELKNDGKLYLALNDTRGANPVELGGNQGNLTVRLGGAPRLSQSGVDGTMTIFGNLVLSGGSCTGCVTAAMAAPSILSQDEVLDKLQSVLFIHWNGTATDLNSVEAASPSNEAEVLHLSPDMESFYNAYGLGLNGTQIAPLDVATISLASVQALNGEIEQQQALIEQQQQVIETLSAQLAEIELRLLRLETLAKR